jgi:hypothetical protein
MKSTRTLLTATAVVLFVVGWSARADTLNNDFSTPFDYVANGIIGDTNWDGVYLRFGDIPGGSAGGSGSGNTIVASTASPYPGFLNLQEAGGDWSGADNDGFFLYKVVQGDFDVSVQNVPATLTGGTGFDNRGFNFTGLMVRLYNTNNSGGPFSTTSTNNSENSLRLWRFDEFQIDGQVRQSTNGANFEASFPQPTTNTFFNGPATNDNRFYRITRTGDFFQFYIKTNAGDAWFLVTNANATGGYVPTNGGVMRPDWAGQRIQVGICHAAFTTATRDAVYDDFQLTSASVSFPVMPAAPSAVVTTATNTGGSLTLSWTVGNPGDSSLVVMSRARIQHNPIQGVTYNASSTFGDVNARLGGGNEFAVYNGTGTSVTVTNLGANNLTYDVAVYEYAAGPSPIYNTASPATNRFFGPGVINAVSLSVPTNEIPVNGAVKIQLFATFSTGESNIDQSINAAWSSGDSTIANVNAVGAVSGLAPGVSTITATFGAFTPSTNITVHSPTFTDTFTAVHDYLANGLLGTPYDGLYLNFGDVPGAVATGDGAGSTVTLNSQITSTNGLYMSSVQSTWQATGNDGPMLYKLVPGNINGVSGDFQALVHINAMGTLNGVFAGMMARLFTAPTHSAGPGGAENHLNYWKVQNGATSIRRTQNGGNTTFVGAGPSPTDGWLLMQRVASTNFYFFEKATTNDLWTFVTNIVLAAASNNAPMEVGMVEQSTAGLNAVATFDSFMVDAPGIVSATPPPPPASNVVMTLNGNLSMTVSYKVGTNGDGTAIRSVVVMRDGGPVSAQPYTGMGLGGNSVFGDPNNSLGDGNYVVYRSASGDTNVNQSVTVTGLVPGHTYYAAVYTFVGLGATRTFNQDASTANAVLQDGTLQFLEVLPTPSIARGGIGFMQVLGHYTGGAILNVSPFATITSANTSIIKALNGVLTGVSNGTVNITLVYSGVTNVAAVTVRDPAYTDNFSVSHDYLVSGVAGTIFQDMYNANATTNPIPGSPYVAPASAGPTVADANFTSNNVLTITAAGDGWEAGLVGGLFLFRYVPGDFQMAIHILTNDYLTTLGPAVQFQYNQPGLLARAYGVDTNGNIGTPFGTVVTNANGTNDLGEYWVSFCRFDEFTIGTYPRQTLDGGVSGLGVGGTTQSGQTGEQGDTNFWLLIVRSKGTEFDFYKRLNENDPWRQVTNKTHYSIPQFAGMPMQVGIMAGPWTGGGGVTRTVHFEKFMLDTTGGSMLQISVSGGNATLSWPPIAGASLQSTTTLVPTNWQPVPGTPTLGPNGYSLTVPLDTGPKFFRLVQ